MDPAHLKDVLHSPLRAWSPPAGWTAITALELHFARHAPTLGQPLVVESVIGTTFSGKVVGTTQFGEYQAVIPEISGTSHITGRHQFVMDPADPLRHGFLI